MKKVLLLCMAICLLILGCEKEGVYNPSKKIKRISTQYQNDLKRLNSEWTWEKNLLKKVQYYSYTGAPSYDERYTYDKNKLVKVEKNDGYYTKILYNGDKYDKMEYCSPQGQIFLSLKFTYEGNKVSQIDQTEFDYDDDKSLQNAGFISNVLSQEVVSGLTKMLSKSKSKSTEYRSRITFKYEGNNISESVLSYSEENFTFKETNTFEKYDKSLNPLYHSNFAVVGSKNNPLELIIKTEETYYDEYESDRYTVSYEYECDGKFPTQVYATTRVGNSSERVITFFDYQK
jgi:hypothetical protein